MHSSRPTRRGSNERIALGTGESYRMRRRPAPDAVAQQVDGELDREIGQHARRHARCSASRSSTRKRPDQRVALRAAVGDVAALDAGARAVAQRADPAARPARPASTTAMRMRSTSASARKPLRSSVRPGSTSTPTMARTGARHDQHVSPTTSSVAGSRPRGSLPRRRARRPSGSARATDGLRRLGTSCPTQSSWALQRRRRRKPALFKHKLARWRSTVSATPATMERCCWPS